MKEVISINKKSPSFILYFLTYLITFIIILISMSLSTTISDFIYFLKTGVDTLNNETYGVIIRYLFQISTFIFFTFLLSRRGRTFIEDVAGIVVAAKEGGRLSFFRSLFRYLLILVTFPFGFGLINFISKEPLYNKWTGAVEYKNENQAIKDGWLYRQVVAAGKKSNATKTS